MTEPTTPQSTPGDPTPGGGAPTPPPPSGWQPAPAPPTGSQFSPAPGVGRPAELMDRFLARLIDHVIIGVVNMVLVTTIIIGSVLGGGGGLFGNGLTFFQSLISAVLSVAISLGYFAYLESTRGQTVGKMIMKLETRDAAGGRPSMEQAVKRNVYLAASLISVVPFIGPVIASLAQIAAVVTIALGINSDTAGRKGWHDNLAGTQVVKVG